MTDNNALANDRFLRALRRPVDRTPSGSCGRPGVTCQYRAARARAGSFMNLCRNPEMACEVTLQPLQRFPLDAAILFSDILTIPDAMGLGLDFVEGEGPTSTAPAQAPTRSSAGGAGSEDELGYVPAAVRTIRSALAGRVPLIGFAGSPWTLACYMIEGKGGTDFRRSKALLAEQPALMHELLDVLTESVLTYLAAQQRAGAQALMVFDSWGGILPPSHFREFSLRHLARIAQGLDLGQGESRTPLIVFSKGANTHLPALADTGADALGLDWTISLAQARELTGDRVALQGNFDPTLLYAKPGAIRTEVARVLADYGKGTGHVFNLGHGITPGVPPTTLAPWSTPCTSSARRHTLTGRPAIRR